MKGSDILPSGLFFRAGRAFFSLFSFCVFRTYSRLVIEGKEHLPNSPFIICSNHQSHLDAIILAHVGSYNFSKSAIIAAKDYWYDHRQRFYLSRCFFNIIPINRKSKSDDHYGFRHVAKISADFISNGGRCIVILPEGTRSKKGAINPFKKGVSLLAKSTNLPVVPVYIKESHLRWPKGSFFIQPGTIHVRVGQHHPPETLDIENGAEALRKAVANLANCSTPL